MPYKDKARQAEYMHGYISGYMRKYRAKRKDPIVLCKDPVKTRKDPVRPAPKNLERSTQLLNAKRVREWFSEKSFPGELTKHSQVKGFTK